MRRESLEKLIHDNQEIIYDKNFFDSLKNTSLLEFRKNINMVQDIRPSLYLEETVDRYYDELLQRFDYKTSLFYDYNIIVEYFKNDDIQILDSYKDFNYFINDKILIQLYDYYHYSDKVELVCQYLKKITNKKISEIIVDGLFKDTIYNVWINLKEMFRFYDSLNQNEKFLTEDKIQFYKKILEIDNIDCKDKIEFYYRFKDKNISLMFYNDLRKIKEISYQKINNQLFSLKDKQKFFNQEESTLYSVSVYDLKDERFFMLIRCMKQFSKDASYRRNCYSIISDEHSEVFSKKGFIYGYDKVELEHILHIFEKDAYSSSKDSSSSYAIRIVNRIMILEQIVSSSRYNEIQIVNRKNKDNDLYEVLFPDYLIVFDRIESRHIEEAKRLNIPIVKIYSNKKKKNIINENLYKFNEYEKVYDDYTDGDYLEEKRSIRRL